MRQVWQFLKLTRPLFLVGGVLLYLLGAFVAFVNGYSPDLTKLITGQVLITSIQLMTHYQNEYYDQESDQLNQARTWFSGGSGVLASGAISSNSVLLAGRLFALVGSLTLIIVTLQIPPLLITGGLALLFAWAYSAPPLALVSTGWGEFFASLLVAGLVPVIGFQMQAGGGISPLLLVICMPLVLLHFSMLIAFQIPDIPADAAAGKRTLAVRLGALPAAWIHNISLFLAFCVILGLSLLNWTGAKLAGLTFPLAVWQAIRMIQIVRKEPDPASQKFLSGYPLFTMGAIGLFAINAMLWLVGFARLWLRF